jgi:hypothetical protein
MTRRRGERGELQVGCIIGAIVLLLAVVIAIKVVPAMMKVYEFQDEIVSIADRASTTRFRNKPKKIVDAVINKAEELNLRVAPDDVEVTFTKKFVTIEVEFDIELEFPGYTRIWHKKIKEERPVW